MSQSQTQNRKFILAERPKGEPDDNTLRLETEALPTPGKGQMLLRNEYLSLDPYMRGRMSDAPSYAAPVEIGQTMVGGTVAQVMSSDVKGFEKDDWVVAFGGWQDYALSDGTGVINLGKDPENKSWALGVLGMPGLTAWTGLTQIGQPKAGETLVVAGASGPVGATVGQIGKILGLRVVGVAGGAEKCAHVVDTLGFDACVDYKADGFPAALKAAAPDGIDIYFENVGGAVFDAVMPLLNTSARIPVCGVISQYNATSLPDGPDRLSLLMGMVLRKRMTLRGFIVFEDFGHLYPEFSKQMGDWVRDGKIKYREEVIEGLEQAPAAFVGLLNGKAFGKRVVKLTA
ncbi:NADP-dependent oxidoreductase [Puniceibacterium antarcticum]|uniref:NADP-dependent oxidoreductase n=1 Tax=Puniceibacterium antarcticum TaxID=1206336 RepID=A0A2G8REZ4_9RHOB|nr:NADP-dependent oxidoreductase [Puniceibacterium antarcticum]PIL20109.1 NADP-dependent oxidoreductase [Puniceibacterium antarcticum]